MKNLVLIGFMGAGKSVVGKILSNKLDVPYIDTDKIIEKEQGVSVKEIFEKRGEQYFREKERETVARVTKEHGMIISVGGGAVLDEENVKDLKGNGTLVYLKAPFTVLYDRIKESENRPLLAVHNPEETMHTLLEARQMTYESIADIVVDVSNANPDEIAKRIIDEYSK